MRKGVLAVPIYFIAVGVGHVALAMYWTQLTVGLPRDGQAFSGTALLGAGFVFLGMLVFAVALAFERNLAALGRGSVAALAVAGAVVAYTASRGYVMGGLTGAAPCIVEGTVPVCAPGTYIADGQPDVFVMLLAAVVAYALAHVAARLQEPRRL
ncbi:MAG: hypothetical protein ABJB39_10230 [Chloroflexota bacterium]